MRKAATPSLVLPSLSILIFIFLVIAQSTNPSLSAEASYQIRPPSMMTLRMLMSNGKYLVASQQEHGVIILESERWQINIYPYRNESGDVFANIDCSFDGQKLVESIRIDKQSPARVLNSTSLPGVYIKTIQLVDITDTTEGIRFNYSSSMGVVQCCITCPPDPRVCAAAVQSPCGECCAGSCPNLKFH